MIISYQTLNVNGLFIDIYSLNFSKVEFDITRAKFRKLFPGSIDTSDRRGLSLADYTDFFVFLSKISCPLVAIFGAPRIQASLTKKDSDVVAFASLIAC